MSGLFKRLQGTGIKASPPSEGSNPLPLFSDPGELYRREHGRYNFNHFIREFIPHHFWGAPSEMHEDFIEWEKQPYREGINSAIAAPRGNAKTTFQVLAKPLHAILYRYYPFIVIIGYSADDAIEKTEAIRDELLNNEKIIKYFGPQISEFAGKANFTTYAGIRVTAKSKGKAIRGIKHNQNRPSLIICDDIESLEGTNTEAQRQKTLNWFHKDVMGSGRADGKTNVTVVGTVLHEDSLLANLLKKPGWRTKKYQAIKSWPVNMDLWRAWEEIYCDLDNPKAVQDARAFYEANQEAMEEGVEVLWPEGEPFYNLMLYKVQNGDAALHSEKQNDPYDPLRQILNPDLCPRFRVLWPTDIEWHGHFRFDSPLWKHRDSGFLIVAQNGGKVIHSSELEDIIIAHDPALANDKTSDYAALVVVAQDSARRLYCLDAFLKKVPTGPQIAQAYMLAEKWSAEKIFLETIGFQKLLKDDYRQIQKELFPEAQVKLVGIELHSDKIARIGTMQPYFENRWLWMNEALPTEFINQIKLFPTVNDDGPDALDIARRQLRRPRGKATQIAIEEVS